MRVNWTRRVAAMLTAVAAAACAPDRSPAPAPPEGVDVAATKMLGTLAVTLSVPADGVPRGAAAVISVDLVNRGDTLARLDAPGGNEAPPFDVIVVRASGDTVWREPPADASRPAVLRENPPLAPGETQAYGTASWDQRDAQGRQVSAGAYLVSVVVYAPAPWGLMMIGPVLLTIQ